MRNVNAETFINKWWSASSPHLGSDLEEWMGKTHSDEHFWKEVVFFEQEHILPASPTIFGKSYNFYHDCILRHVNSNTVAFSIIHERDQEDNWNYERLHHCVNFHVDKWSYHSPQQGQLMAIVASPGIHFLISLLTALRFGLKICYIPTNSPYLGMGQITKFLSDIQPDLIASEDPAFTFEGIPILTVNEKAVDEENYNPHSFAYLAESAVLVTLSMQEQEALSLATLDAHTLHLHSLRDALFTLNLLQHPYWCAPLACPIRTEPFSILMSLLSGITRVYVPDTVIRKDPLILQGERVNLLGISSELQQLWTKVPAVPTRNLKCCYRSPFDMNFQAWKTFVQLNKLEKVPSCHVLTDNAFGGISLFSKPTFESFDFYLRPTLGTAWTLNNMNGGGEISLNGFGIFTTHVPLGQKNPHESNFTVTQIEKNLMITGLMEPCREGITFPIFEFEDSVSELPFVEGCMIHPMPKAGAMFSTHFVLLTFVSPMKQAISEKDTDGWTTEIQQKIIDRLGRGFLPDQIEYFPLLPKMNGLDIDRNWCVTQYTSGLLSQKKNLPHYQILTILKKLVKRVSHVEEAIKS